MDVPAGVDTSVALRVDSIGPTAYVTLDAEKGSWALADSVRAGVVRADSILARWHADRSVLLASRLVEPLRLLPGEPGPHLAARIERTLRQLRAAEAGSAAGAPGRTGSDSLAALAPAYLDSLAILAQAAHPLLPPTTDQAAVAKIRAAKAQYERAQPLLDAERSLGEGLALLEVAEKHVREALQLNPFAKPLKDWLIAVLLRRAQASIQGEDWAALLQASAALSWEDPYDLSAWEWQVTALANLERWQDAVEQAEAGLLLIQKDLRTTDSLITGLDPKRLDRAEVSMHLDAGKSNFELRRPQPAIDHFRKASALTTEAHDLAEIDKYLEALCLDPNPEVFPLLRAAEDAIVAGQDSVALWRLRHLAGLVSTPRSVRQVALDLYNHVEDRNTALELLYRAVNGQQRTRPGTMPGCTADAKDDSLLWADYCQCCYYEGRRALEKLRDRARAHKYLEQVVDVAGSRCPEYAEALVDLVVLLRGRPTEANAYLQRALEVEGQLSEAYLRQLYSVAFDVYRGMAWNPTERSEKLRELNARFQKRRATE